MIPRIVSGLAGPALMTLLGWSVLFAFGALRDRSRTVRTAYAFLIGLALLGLALWALSLAGWVRLDRSGVLATAATLTGLAAIAGMRRRRRASDGSSAASTPSHREETNGERWSRIALISAALLVGGGLLLEATTDLPDEFDGRMTWVTQARFLAAEATVLPSALTVDDIYVTHPRYPILLPLGQVVSVALARHALEPFAAEPLYALFYLVLLAVVFDGARRAAGRGSGWLAALLVALLPVISSNPDGGAAGAYSDLPLGCFLGAGLVLAGERRFDAVRLGLAGWMLAAAAVCKNEGLVLVPIALLGVALVRRLPTRDLATRLALLAGPVAAAVALLMAWRRRIPNRFDEAYFETFSLAKILAGFPENLFQPAGNALSLLFRFADWGFFWPIALGAAALGAAALRRRAARPHLLLFGTTLGIAGVTYSLQPDLGLVGVTWNRFLIQVLVPLTVLLAMALQASRRRLAAWGSLARLREIRESAATWIPQPSPASPLRFGGAALLLGGLTALFLKPAWQGISRNLGPDWGDPLLNLYFIKWGAQRIAHGLSGFWTAPFFHPTQGTMTLSDHLIGPAGATWALGLVGVGPVAAYNLLLLFSFVGSGLATCWVLARSGTSWKAALFGGIALAFTHFRFDQLSHLQILLMPWIPLALWSFDRLLARPTVGRAALFFLFYALQISGGTYLAYMLHFPLAILAVNRLLDRSSRARLGERGAIAVLVTTAFGCGVVALSFFLPYLRYASTLGIRRETIDIVPYAAVVWSWLTPTARSLVDGLGIGPPYRGENGLFPGFLPLALSVLGLPLLWRLCRGPRWCDLDRDARRLLLAGAGAVVLGLGFADFYTLTENDRPSWLRGLALHHYSRPSMVFFAGILLIAVALARSRRGDRPDLGKPDGGDLVGIDPIWIRGLLASGLVSTLLAHPIVFFTLRSWVPGMDGMRVPQRFWAFALPALALAAGVGLDAVTNALRSSAARRLLPLTACALLAAELAPKSFEWTPVASQTDLPRSTQFLRDEPTVRGVLVLPLFGDHREAERMWLASFHGKPIANGYSGFLPASYRAFQERFDPFPVSDDLHDLRRLGLSHLEVHWDLFEASTRRTAFERISAAEKAGVLKVVFEEEPVVVYVLPDD